MKRYHPAPTIDLLSSSTSSSTVKTQHPSTQTEVLLVDTQKVTQSSITQHPMLHVASSSSHHQSEEAMQIVTVDSPMPPTTTSTQNPVEDDNSISQLQEERSNQSSPIPTKNVDTGGGRKLPMSVNKHAKTSPVIGIINMASQHIVVKEDSMDSENGLINQIASTSSSSDMLLVGAIADQEDTEMQAVKITTNAIDGGCPSSFGPVTQSRELSARVVSTSTTTSTAAAIIEDRSSRLAKNVFNTISPPNKTVTDALSTFSDTPPVPLEEPSVFSTNPGENIFSHGGGTELDAVVDSVISNSNSSLQF